MRDIGILLLIIYVGWGVYKQIRPGEKGIAFYINRGAKCERYFLYKKAFAAYEEAKALPSLKPVQRAMLDFCCGRCLLKQKKYKRAVPYFERAFEQEVGIFLYNRQLKLVIKGVMLAGEHELARKLFEKLAGSSQSPKWRTRTHLFDVDRESK